MPTPFPSLVTRQPVKVVAVEGPAQAHIANAKVLHVPLGDDPESFYYRTREIARLRWGNSKGERTNLRAIAEHYRLNRLMLDAGISLTLSPTTINEETESYFERTINFGEETKSYFERVTFDPELRLLPATTRLVAIEEQVYDLDWRKPKSVDVLVKLLRDNQVHEYPLFLLQGENESENENYYSYLSDATDATEEWEDDRKMIASALGMHVANCYQSLTEEKGSWGKMQYIQKPLRYHLRDVLTRGRRVKPRTVDNGMRVRRPGRLLQDGRAFLKNQKGGTVLIDASGSMRIRTETLLQFLQTNPAGTVATYHSKESDTKGQLNIIARRGRVIGFEEEGFETGGGNVIDGPALEWLGTQAKPRIWICDGQVTGCFDCQYQNLTLHAAELMLRHGITRHDSLEDFNGKA